MQQSFAIGGSGSTYIYGLVDATHRDNMSRTECQDFVKKGESASAVCCLVDGAGCMLTLSLLPVSQSFRTPWRGTDPRAASCAR